MKTMVMNGNDVKYEGGINTRLQPIASTNVAYMN